ncbi:phenylalanyl-tRNA synthetase alpha subunit [Hypnocyclicus thermotrophus]|uniref:Phenylalanine--tRNA ligase alpha subunit n=1 Tax=Hypnocyclicus thermotrophus TaxID=1627895 RepID=A0AA46DYC0_9FUSO|nr:phenylalanine--tRNA ligase subunit alpha [Hypnocyclicus thermotrophus]TDT69805.1 phenylalanyl-tRNA synthetase alpha subunit [Hypnocyclicus thermotrophus]
MKDKLLELRKEAEELIKKVESSKELDDIRVQLLGKKGKITDIMKGMKSLSNDERPVIGKLVNEIKSDITKLLEVRLKELSEKEKLERIENEFIDITLPSRKIGKGGYHPVTETQNLLKRIFTEMGFDIADGPEVEDTYYNFDALNIPETHSSRDLQDTFYIADDVVLRTHTSPVQIRYMKEHKPPFRMIATGRVYRSDYDVSHTPMFHQIEGLMIGENISFANLKAILTEFVKKVFGDTNVRFRPHFFPFTEPSAEMDVECVICKGKGCRLCKHTGWLEIMGCGMVDPEVLKEGGYDPKEVSGFAFGMGIERIAMLRHGIDDLRAFYDNDMRFLKQFKK